MQFTTTTLAVLAAAASTVSATTFKVTVGNGSLVYSPNDIKAAAGDNIEFSFFPKNHTVSQSSFADPCHPLAGGFSSGFVPTASPVGSTFTITVNDTKPIWIYCGQTVGNHCQSGMVAAINAPATGNTLAAFKAKALNATTSTTTPGGAVGGILKINSASGTGSSSTTTAAATETKTVTTSVVETIVTTVSKDTTTYATTYPTTVATTYTTAVSNTDSGSTSTSTSASSTASTTVVPASGADRVLVGGSVAGAALVAVFALL